MSVRLGFSLPAVELLAGVYGMCAVFGACLFGLLIATWTGWAELSYATFFMASSLTAYYVRPGNLLPVVVSAPLLFLLACLSASVLAPSLALIPELAGVAWWMLSGMALTIVIAVARGLRSEVQELLANLRQLPDSPGLTGAALGAPSWPLSIPGGGNPVPEAGAATSAVPWAVGSSSSP